MKGSEVLSLPAESGLKEALQYAVESARPPVKTFTVDNSVYATEQLYFIGSEPKKRPQIVPLKITTLYGFLDYIKENRDNIPMDKTFIQVTGPSSVRLVSVPITGPDNSITRDVYIESEAELPRIRFGDYMPTENFIIALQSSFVPSGDQETLLRYIGNLKEDESVQVTDDGVSQKIVARTGVASMEAVILPNPVRLRPYRTFQELEQPESEFVLRVRKGGEAALFEADGGEWKVTCRTLIKAALRAALGSVVGACVIS